MSKTDFRWMPHHEGAVPKAGQGNRISTYTVALEGWRRGLNLKFYGHYDEDNNFNVRYSLSNETKTHHFQLSMGDAVTKKAFDICNNKEITKQYLKNAEIPVPVPEGRVFYQDSTDEDITSFAKTMNFPIVFKPTDGNAGNGVFANIESLEELEEIIPYVREELEFKEVMIENYIPGREFRIFVIDDRVLGGMIRRPASVLGDGQHTIKELIHRANEIRMTNPHLTSRLIKVDLEIRSILKRKGYKLSTIPNDGERIFLREKSNLSKGGDAIDVTDRLTDNLKDIARNVGKAIPGLQHYGVDMIVDEDNDTGVILEVNTRPGFGGHLFPMEGTPRDFAKEIIDFYFPETENQGRSWLYFDFDSALEPILNNTTSTIEINTISPESLYGRKLTLSGDIISSRFHNRVKRLANRRKLNGYLQKQEDDTLVIVAAGTDPSEVQAFIDECSNDCKDVEITSIEVEEWNKPVKMSFEIRRRKTDLNPVQLEREIEILNKEIVKLKNSNSWKVTKPLRAIGEIKKKF